MVLLLHFQGIKAQAPQISFPYVTAIDAVLSCLPLSIFCYKVLPLKYDQLELHG